MTEMSEVFPHPDGADYHEQFAATHVEVDATQSHHTGFTRSIRLVSPRHRTAIS